MLALIRFKLSGNVYYGYYEDSFLLPFVCPVEESNNPIAYCKHIADLNKDIPLAPIPRPDEVEIFIDRDEGIYWSAKGNETLKVVFNDPNQDKKTGKPQWVRDFYVVRRKKTLANKLNLLVMQYEKWAHASTPKVKAIVRQEVRDIMEDISKLLGLTVKDGPGEFMFFGLDS